MRTNLRSSPRRTANVASPSQRVRFHVHHGVQGRRFRSTLSSDEIPDAAGFGGPASLPEFARVALAASSIQQGRHCIGSVRSGSLTLEGIGHVHISRRYTGLPEGRRRAMTVPCARRREQFRAGFRREEQLLQIGLRHFLKPSPLRNREKHCRFDAAPGHDLRPFPGTRVEKLTEPGLRFLNLPSSAHASPRVNATDHLYDHSSPAARWRRAEAEPTTEQRSGNSVHVTAIRTTALPPPLFLRSLPARVALDPTKRMASNGRGRTRTSLRATCARARVTSRWNWCTPCSVVPERPSAALIRGGGRRRTHGTVTGNHAAAHPERNSDTDSLSCTHAGTSFRAPPTGNCSSRIRRCCPNFFLNFLSRCPWWPQASTRAVRRASFGSCTSSTLDGRGRPSGPLPFGFPATLRIASSSRRIHASVVLTGTT